MRIVIAPDKFKGSLTASAVAAAIADGVRDALPDAAIDLCPIADGGDGTVAALVAATGGRIVTRRVCGPLPEMQVDADFGILGRITSGIDGMGMYSCPCPPPDQQHGHEYMPMPSDVTAVIEMAAASGVALLRADERDPMATTTFGTGQLMVEAARLGATRIILGIGGSATIDGGIGCCQAVGLPVLLADGEPSSPTEPLCGRDLDRVVLVKHGRGSPVERTRITVACDVTNPLFGETGAAAVFGPQKGATPAQVAWFDRQLQALAERTGKLAEAQSPGAGAAGGLGFALRAYFPNAELRPGVEIVFAAVGLRERLRGADLCITGEGRLDASSLHGKAPVAVAEVCREMGVPCVAIVGSYDESAIASSPFEKVHAVQANGMSLEEAIRRGPVRLRQLARNAIPSRRL